MSIVGPVAGVETESDESLVALIRQGDERAARVLHDRYARRLLGLVSRRMGKVLREKTEAEDIVQSVLRSVFLGFRSGQYDAPEGETLWNLMAAIAFTKLRKNGQFFTAQCRDGERECSWDQIDGDRQVIGDSSLQAVHDSLTDLLGSLRESEREVILLRLKRHSIEEISVMIGRSRRSVERVLQKCRQRFTHELMGQP